jgi:hypothetical protein
MRQSPSRRDHFRAAFRLVIRPQDPWFLRTIVSLSRNAGHHQIFAASSHGFGFDQRDLWSEERISAGADLSFASTGLTLEWLERMCAEASVANISGGY